MARKRQRNNTGQPDWQHISLMTANTSTQHATACEVGSQARTRALDPPATAVSSSSIQAATRHSSKATNRKHSTQHAASLRLEHCVSSGSSHYTSLHLVSCVGNGGLRNVAVVNRQSAFVAPPVFLVCTVQRAVAATAAHTAGSTPCQWFDQTQIMEKRCRC